MCRQAIGRNTQLPIGAFFRSDLLGESTVGIDGTNDEEMGANQSEKMIFLSIISGG